MLLNEYNALREELRNLKSCQITFLNISITTTGLLIGFLEKSVGENTTSTIYLAPLVIILPFWLVFFDKATTITRIVGYMRILENFIIQSMKTSAANCRRL